MRDKQVEAILSQLTDLNTNLSNLSVLLEALVRVQLGILNMNRPNKMEPTVKFEEIIERVAESQRASQETATEQTIDKHNET